MRSNNPRGIHPPWVNDAFPPCFRFPLFPKKFSDSVENFPNFTFFKFFRFSSAKISYDLFLVINHKFRIFPPSFPISIHFPISPPISPKLFFPPYFSTFTPCFRHFSSFLHTLYDFCFPLIWPWCIYASHNARNGRPWIILRRIPWNIKTSSEAETKNLNIIQNSIMKTMI